MVGREALDAADVHGIVNHAATAVHLARMLADEAANEGQWVVLADEAHGVGVATSLDQGNVARDVDACWAARHTGDTLALDKAAGLVSNVVLKVIAEAANGCERHLASLVPDGAIARQIDSAGSSLDELERMLVSPTGKDVLHELLEDTKTDTTGSALAAALDSAHADKGRSKLHRTWCKRTHSESLAYRLMETIHDDLSLAALHDMKPSHSIILSQRVAARRRRFLSPPASPCI
ncbi:hypothetical protein HMPREF9069_01277 [Atopobium sp. oral taxon 810 str. F0209]|nr:hypothetical protein HMPREF9069_01277 [Atopobium sp. oral taxon 810 str. F0209]